MSRVAGRPMRLEFEVLPETGRATASPPTAASRQRQRQQITRHPFVERAMQLFEAEVMNVDVGKEPPG